VFSPSGAPCQKAFVGGLKRSFKLYRSACEADLGYRLIEGCGREIAITAECGNCLGFDLRAPGRREGSVERDGDEARAQQHKTGRGYREKSIGDEIVTTHDAPAISSDDRPTLLKISESPDWQPDAAAAKGFERVREEYAGH
jgi:hypothetical protein